MSWGSPKNKQQSMNRYVKKEPKIESNPSATLKEEVVKNSESLKEEEKTSKNQLMTIGYSAFKDINSFISELQKAKVTNLVDVRITPYSTYNKAFNSQSLEGSLLKFGIRYHHFQELGNLFHTLPEKDSAVKMYTELVQKVGHLISQRLMSLVENSSSSHVCIMCACSDHLECHRNIISTWVSETFNIQIVHLRN